MNTRIQYLRYLEKKFKNLKVVMYLTRNNLTIESMKINYHLVVYSNVIYFNILQRKLKSDSRF